MRTILLCVLLAVVGCGSAPSTEIPDMTPVSNFAGTWSGTLAQSTTTCSDGSTAPARTDSVTLQIAQSPTEISWPIACGITLTASVIDDTDAVQPGSSDCPSSTVNGRQVVESFGNIQAKVNGNALTLSYIATANIAATSTASAATCTTPVSGTLAKQ